MTTLQAELVRKELSFVYSHMRVFLNLFLNQKQTARATTLLERVIKMNPENAKARFNLGIAHRRLGNTERALEHLEKVIILEPENSEACSLLGVLKDQI